MPSANVDMKAPDGTAATEHAYTVLWRVTNIGAAPVCLRDVEVQVQWQEDGFAAAKAYQVGTRRYNQGDANC
jgi:hypothetical protein